MLTQFKDDAFLSLDLVRSVLRQNGLIKRKAAFARYQTREGIVFKMRRDVWDSAILMETWWLKEYHRHLKHLGRNPVVVDIGAHMGDFSLFIASKIPGSKVFALEPNPQNFDLLAENIELNSLGKRVIPIRLAVAPQSGKKIRIFCHPDNLGMHAQGAYFKHFGVEAESFFDAETISLEDVLRKNRIKKCDLLKIDCEGCEYPIFESVSDVVLAAIKNISLEYHRGGDIEKLRRRLEGAGFRTKFEQATPVVNVAPLLYAWRES
jgi:FkbM family methyltransferase